MYIDWAIMIVKKGKKQCAHLKAFALGTWNPYMYEYGQDNYDCQKK